MKKIKTLCPLFIFLDIRYIFLKIKGIEMLIWKFLFLLLFSNAIANTVEYMGMSFECNRGCALPGYEGGWQLVETFQNVIHQSFDHKWGLVDDEGIWRKFNPYEENNDGIIEEICDITRYDWKKSNRILIHSGENYGGKVTPNSEYQQWYPFDLTHSSISCLFSFFREDLSFYASEREKYLQNRLKTHQQNLVEIARLRDDSSGVLYESDTDRVLYGIRWSHVPAHESYSHRYGTYCRQIGYAQIHEEEEVRRVEEELKNPQYESALEIIDTSYQKSENFLKRIFLFCLQNHQPEGIEFQAAIESLLNGDPLDGIDHLRKLLAIGEENHYSAQIISELHLLKGQLESESALYADAIVSLTEAIAKMPSTKEAYIERAAAYFELGEFDLCLKDYLQSSIKPESETPLELFPFSLGLTKGLLNGGAQAGIEFIPSLLASLQGIGQGLWAFAQDPVQISSEFAQAAHACIEFIKDHPTTQVFTELVPELKELAEKWNSLDDRKRGEVTGGIIGKYGVEIFAGAGLVKGVKLYRNLKRANNLLTFETLALSEKHKAFIKAEAARKATARKTIIQSANLKIVWKDQGKHVVGHERFDANLRKSLLTHPDPQKLAEKFAGTGVRVGNRKPGAAGYQEIVNFGEMIGFDIRSDTGIQTPTTWGKIHYAKNGVHIVPTQPR